MRGLQRDLKYALRQLGSHPGFAAISVTTLALGIASTTVVFSTVEALFFEALPYPDADRLVSVTETSPGDRSGRVAAVNFRAWDREAGVFRDLTAFTGWDVHLHLDDRTLRIRAVKASTDFFRTLRVDPATGRSFSPDDGELGGGSVVMLSESLARRAYGSVDEAVGRVVRLDGAGYTVVGVVDDRMAFPPGTELWSPTVFPPQSEERELSVVGRLVSGVSREQARADMSALARRLRTRYPVVNKGRGADVGGLLGEQRGYTRSLLVVLLAAVGLVLAITCANVATLLLVRARQRTREIAVRRALGADRGRLYRLLLTESVLLAILGGGLGVLLALAGVQALEASLPGELARLVAGWDALGIDGRVLGATLAVSLVSGLAFGLAPALRSDRLDLQSELKEGASRAVGGTRSRTRRWLVGGQVALSVVLLVGAGLTIKSFTSLLGGDTGFRPDGVATLHLSLSSRTFDTAGERRRYFRRLLREVSSHPEVETAGLVSYLPFSRSGGGTYFAIEGRPADVEGSLRAEYRVASAGYFRTLGIPLLAGRRFRETDGPTARPVAIVNRAMAERFWPEGDPVGARLRLTSRRTATIVGVVGNVHHYGLREDPRPEIYVPVGQAPSASTFLAARTAGRAESLLTPLRNKAASLDRDVAVSRVETMEDLVSDFLAPDRIVVGLLGTFAVIALVIAAVGLYGIVSFSVVQRVPEIGLRLALGASPAKLVRRFVGEGVRVGLIGIAAGLTASLVFSRGVRSVLYQVAGHHPALYAAVAASMLGVVAAASYVPARRVTELEPRRALRHE